MFFQKWRDGHFCRLPPDARAGSFLFRSPAHILQRLPFLCLKKSNVLCSNECFSKNKKIVFIWPKRFVCRHRCCHCHCCLFPFCFNFFAFFTAIIISIVTLTKNELFVCCFAFDIFKNGEETGEKNKKMAVARFVVIFVVSLLLLLPFCCLSLLTKHLSLFNLCLKWFEHD